LTGVLRHDGPAVLVTRTVPVGWGAAGLATVGVTSVRTSTGAPHSTEAGAVAVSVDPCRCTTWSAVVVWGSKRGAGGPAGAYVIVDVYVPATAYAGWSNVATEIPGSVGSGASETGGYAAKPKGVASAKVTVPTGARSGWDEPTLAT
jgi:hypothetical protein